MSAAPPDDALRRWLHDDGQRGPLLVGRDGRAQPADLDAVALLPGSFNPLHEGHRGLARAAQAQSGREVLFELSVTNVDKPPLEEQEVARRIAQFRGEARALLTRAPRFVDKARATPGATFVLGWDTFVRLFEVRYYASAEAMEAAIREIADLDCRFLVAGRLHGGRYRALDTGDVPEAFRPLFEAIPEAAFRLDISSTELRARDAG